MPRGRRSSSASSDGPSRSRSQRRSARSPSQGGRSRQRSPSRSPARSKSRGGPPLSRHHSSGAAVEKEPSSSGPGVKGSLLFLGTIAAAAFTAHKVWPKGVLYGHKEDWEHEHEQHESKKSHKSTHRQREPPSVREDRDRDRGRGRAVPPPPAGPRYQDRSPRDAPPPPWSEERRRVVESSARPTAIPFESNRSSQSTGSGSGSGTPPRKYLPYEPGVYTPSSVLASSSSGSSTARGFEQRRRERPVLLPLERPHGYLPSVPVAPSARRVFEDEGYESRESVPVPRAARYQGVDGVEYRR